MTSARLTPRATRSAPRGPAPAPRPSSPVPGPSAPARARGIPGLELVEKGGLAHRLEHVEVVVAGRAVRAEAERHAGGEILRHRRHAARQLHVALGVVRDADVVAPSGSRCRRRSPRRRAPRRFAAPRSRSTRDSRQASACDASRMIFTSSSVSARCTSIGTPYFTARSRHASSVSCVERVGRMRRDSRRDRADRP